MYFTLVSTISTAYTVTNCFVGEKSFYPGKES